LRKIEAKAQMVSEQGELFACPVCHEPLEVTGTSLVCPEHHQFDLAKKGTVNFLNAPVATEYGTAMLAARRRVLSAGFFDQFLAEIATELTPGDRFLDIGCGEGTPTAKLAATGATGIGFDISAPAINLAGALDAPAFYCVADLARLPFLDDTFSAVVDLFSPGAYAEFNRVLRPGGQILKVIPDADYLHELRQGLYAGTPKGTYSNARVMDRFLAVYPHATVTPIAYDFAVTPELFADVVAMTPLTWQAPAAAKAALLAAPPASVHVAVDLLRVQVD
jgi:23S rRNA (guanine745-N1)-methyltransferase